MKILGSFNEVTKDRKLFVQIYATICPGELECDFYKLVYRSKFCLNGHGYNESLTNAKVENIKVDDNNSKATVRKKGALKGSNKRGYNC